MGEERFRGKASFVIRVNAVVEGQTEETFVQECLARHFVGFDVTLTPRRVEFGRKKGRIYRGGLLEYPKLRKDVMNWLNQDTNAMVTTMVDLYALPEEFPGRSEGARIRDPYARTVHLEAAFGEDIDSARFIPHIQLHEFEAFLFTDISKLAGYYPGYRSGIEILITEATRYESPELIDEGKLTAPSKRILREVPVYDKVVAGSIIAMEIGLPFIRSKCRHFDAWARRLEALGQAQA
jgi:hypothetical protein